MGTKRKKKNQPGLKSGLGVCDSAFVHEEAQTRVEEGDVLKCFGRNATH